MAALPASGGVRSLLAKFENSNGTPDVSPSRGRTSTEPNDNATNRPLSKVRASFVSVERNSQGSPTPGALRRTESYNTDADSSQRSATVSPTGQREPSLASPFSPSPAKVRTALAAFQGDSVGNINNKLAALTLKDDSNLSTTSTGKPEIAQASATATPTTKPSNKLAPSAPIQQPAAAVASKTMKKSASTMAISKEPSASKNPANTAPAKDKKPAAAPTRSATTTTRPTIQSDKPTANRTSAVKSTAPAARSKTPSQDAIKKPAMQSSPQSKPAGKSPTRPARLPASLMTPTTASAARTGALARSQSHVNLRSSPKTETAKTLSRKPSTLRSDASSRLGTHAAPDRPRSRMSTASSRAPQEESFLARMMRPTASSASKMHDKVEPRSPPRLAKVAVVAPKKEKSVSPKNVGNKREKHEQSAHNGNSVMTVVEKKVDRSVLKDVVLLEEGVTVPSENGGSTERSTTVPEVEISKPETEVSVEKPFHETPAVDVAINAPAQPHSQPTPVEKEPKAAAEVSPEDPMIAEEKGETVEKQAGNAELAIEVGTVSVPETVHEEPDHDAGEAAPKPNQQDEVKGDSTEETIIEVEAAQEEPKSKLQEHTVQDKTEDGQVEGTEPAQSLEQSDLKTSEESVPDEVSTEKAEESQAEPS